MTGDLGLTISMVLNGFDHLLIPFSFILYYPLRKKFFQLRPIGKPLALGNFGNMMALAEMVRMAFNECFVSQKDLAFDICPNRVLVDSP